MGEGKLLESSKFLVEVNNMANAAKLEAQKATSKAEASGAAIEAHEKICAERYKNINDHLVQLALNLTNFQTSTTAFQSNMQTSVNALNNANSQSAGRRTGIKEVSQLVGLLMLAVTLLTLFGVIHS